MYEDITNWVVISDLHSGCQLGLCPPEGVQLDEGGFYLPSSIQQKVWAYWRDFWDVWVPHVTEGEPFGVEVNGDILDGVHHRSTHQITHNLTDQAKIAAMILQPIFDLCEGRMFIVRGTEAHVGQSGAEEERLACELGVVPNNLGQYARFDLWKTVGDGLVHFLHHIGTTSSNAYEATAVNKELTEEFNEAARWNERAPNIIVRSHRHRSLKVTIPTAAGEAIAVVTPGWQAKTPFAWRVAGARLAPPQFGGIVIRQGDDELYTRSKTYTIGRTDIE